MRYLDFCVVVKFSDFKLCSVIMIISIATTIKMKLGQILQYCMINISNMFFAQCYRLENSSRPYFIKMTVNQYLQFLNETFSFFE